MSKFYDALETRSGQERTEQQFTQLSATLNQAIDQSPYYKELLADFAGLNKIDAETLAKLPLTRKSELQAIQQEQPPFGRLAKLSPRP